MGSIRQSLRRLRLATSLEGQSAILVSVQDSGPGIATKHSSRVFDPFFTTKPSGMGLGLSICHMIVEGHGGELRLVRGNSSGCTFEIVLKSAAGGIE
jgi:C4-dicarboxylate-specific signal transduction histidine kinase